MGIDIHGIRGLLVARSIGVDYSTTLTIGRQMIYCRRKTLESMLRALQVPFSAGGLDQMFGDRNLADTLFQYLGARDFKSLDFSDYEGASVIHDMNQPVANELENQFSLVMDGGSLEHVFNYPIAVSNCMRMVKPEGHFLSITMANNYMGHGFYQFSPELYFSLLDSANGFAIKQIILYEEQEDSVWYGVRSPKEVRSRVTLINNRPVMMLVIAKKLKAMSGPLIIPQQSDYVSLWNPAQQASNQAQRSGRVIRRIVPASVKNLAKRVISLSKRKPVYNPAYFYAYDWIRACQGVEESVDFRG